MKKLILITLLLSLHSSPSFAKEIVGKGFICEDSLVKNIPFSFKGYWFLNEREYEFWVNDQMSISGDKFSYKKSWCPPHTYYFIKDKKIFLKFKREIKSKLIIDRYISIIINLNKNTFEHFADLTLVGKGNCDIFSNKALFLEKFEEISNFFREL